MVAVFRFGFLQFRWWNLLPEVLSVFSRGGDLSFRFGRGIGIGSFGLLLVFSFDLFVVICVV